MHRTQIQLEERQYRFLKTRAKLNQSSMSALLREMIEEHILKARVGTDPLLELVGMAEGPDDSSARDHDKILYGDKNEEA